MDDPITVCIPTRNRPGLLREAVESCFGQAYRPLEILVGDDSSDDRTKRMADAITPPAGVTLRYLGNTPPLGQTGNVNRLFRGATGRRLMLLHDDDLLLPGALNRLVEAWDDHRDVAAVYGKRYMAAEDGEVLEDQTEKYARFFHMTADWEGPQESAVVSAIWQQIANDGYLVRTDLAQAVGFRPPEVASRMVDWDFAVRLALAAGPAKFIYVDEFTVKYRLTTDSVARSGTLDPGFHVTYENLAALDLSLRDREACQEVFERVAIRAFRTCIRLGLRRRALRIYLSPHYAPRRLSAQGLYHLLTIAVPPLMAWRERLLLGRGGHA